MILLASWPRIEGELRLDVEPSLRPPDGGRSDRSVSYRFSTRPELSTYSDGNKAMGSKPRTIFGEFIKGGLESAGVLRRGEPITDEVLEAYGRDSVTLTKLTNGEYVVTF